MMSRFAVFPIGEHKAKSCEWRLASNAPWKQHRNQPQYRLACQLQPRPYNRAGNGRLARNLLLSLWKNDTRIDLTAI